MTRAFLSRAVGPARGCRLAAARPLARPTLRPRPLVARAEAEDEYNDGELTIEEEVVEEEEETGEGEEFEEDEEDDESDFDEEVDDVQQQRELREEQRQANAYDQRDSRPGSFRDDSGWEDTIVEVSTAFGLLAVRPRARARIEPRCRQGNLTEMLTN